MACGFRPRSAREVDDGAEVRIEKIFSIISECRYGIHDICRTELDEDNRLPRFNMPLELGLFLSSKKFGGADHNKKRALIFDIERFRYQRFISDLAGMDIHGHRGEPIAALRDVRDWLANVSRRQLPSANRLERVYNRFLADFPAICDELEFEPDQIPYVDFERLVAAWLLQAPEIE